jgi:hypothetical protein
MKTKRRKVWVEAPVRKCLYCLSADGPFEGEEHAVPRAFGTDADRFVIPPGGVCDRCNEWLGAEVDGPFVARFDVQLTRGLEQMTNRRGKLPDLIEGREPGAELLLDIDGARVKLLASAVATPDGGLDIALRPVARDPEDIVARTIRALWKMALGAMYLSDAVSALDRRWDHLRHAVLGAPFRGYLLQLPFRASRSGHLRISVDSNQPESPIAMVFSLGGLGFALPIAPGASLPAKTAIDAGWEVHPSSERARHVVRLRLDPDDNRDSRDGH